VVGGKKCLAEEIFTGAGPENSIAMVVVVKHGAKIGAEMLLQSYIQIPPAHQTLFKSH
jgi:hypothetical protein